MSTPEKPTMLSEDAIQEKVLKLCNAQTSDEIIIILKDPDITTSIIFDAILKSKDVYKILPSEYKTPQNTFMACNSDLTSFQYIPDEMLSDERFNMCLNGLLFKDCRFSLKYIPISYQTSRTVETIIKFEPSAITSVKLNNYTPSDILNWLCLPDFYNWLETHPNSYTNIDTEPQDNILETINTIIHQHYPNIYYAIQLGLRHEELHNLIKLTLENKTIIHNDLTNDLPEILY